MYRIFLFELEEYGNPNDYLSIINEKYWNKFMNVVHENYDFFYGLEAELEELIETHNYFPGLYNFFRNK